MDIASGVTARPTASDWQQTKIPARRTEMMMTVNEEIFGTLSVS
jgi:hypothetical protein